MARHSLLVALLLALASCSTLQEQAEPAVGGPADHVIVFGSVRLEGLLLDEPLELARVVQVDPAFPGMEVEPAIRGNMFFTDPLPVGSRWRITSLSFGQEELAVSIDVRLDQPGLLFLGSLEIPGDASRAAAVRVLSVPSERELLLDLLDAWKGTAWERPITYQMRRK